MLPLATSTGITPLIKPLTVLLALVLLPVLTIVLPSGSVDVRVIGPSLLVVPVAVTLA